MIEVERVAQVRDQPCEIARIGGDVSRPDRAGDPEPRLEPARRADVDAEHLARMLGQPLSELVIRDRPLADEFVKGGDLTLGQSGERIGGEKIGGVALDFLGRGARGQDLTGA